MAGIEEYLNLIKNAVYGKDVRQAIHDGIHQCYEDGKAGATDLVARESISQVNAVLSARIDELIAPSGEAPSAAEVTDARIGTDGTTYTSLGLANRKQFSALNSGLDAVSPKWSTTFTLKKNVNGNGNISTNNYTAMTDYIPVSEGDVIVRRIPARDSKGYALLCYVSQFTDTSFVSRTQVEAGDVVTIAAGTTRVIVSFGRTTNSGVEIAQSDVDSYFDVGIYRHAVRQREFDEKAVFFRGNISDLGYTSLSSCTQVGFYIFSGSDSLSDLPAGWVGGGLLETFNNTKNVLWQRITGTTASYRRYGVDGEWKSEETTRYIRVEYEGNAGDDDSTEQLNIYIPVTVRGKKFQIKMGHCVDTDSNANVWRIMFAYINGRQLTMRGEWECALHLADRDDFSGGIVHGDEVDQSVAFFADGTLVTDISALGGYYNELKVVRLSAMYDPADHTTRIAEHGVEYIFNKDGVTIKQSVKWLVDASLTNCFLAMLPIIKAYSTQRFDDTSFGVVDNNQSNYNVLIPDATEVTEYNSNYDTFMTMGINEYPTGLTGGDRARVTDNGGLNYNKVYFQVCSSENVSAGTLWKAESYYRAR